MLQLQRRNHAHVEKEIPTARTSRFHVPLE